MAPGPVAGTSVTSERDFVIGEPLEQLPRQWNALAVHRGIAVVALDCVHATRLVTDDARKMHSTHLALELHRSGIACKANQQKHHGTLVPWFHIPYLVLCTGCHGHTRTIKFVVGRWAVSPIYLLSPITSCD